MLAQVSAIAVARYRRARLSDCWYSKIGDLHGGEQLVERRAPALRFRIRGPGSWWAQGCVSPTITGLLVVNPAALPWRQAPARCMSRTWFTAIIPHLTGRPPNGPEPS